MDGPFHGYAIIKRAKDATGSPVRLATGILDTAFDHLTHEGYIRLVSAEIVNGRARRSYVLTQDGSAALRAEATRMAQAAQVVSRHDVNGRRASDARPRMA